MPRHLRETYPLLASSIFQKQAPSCILIPYPERTGLAAERSSAPQEGPEHLQDTKWGVSGALSPFHPPHPAAHPPLLCSSKKGSSLDSSSLCSTPSLCHFLQERDPWNKSVLPLKANPSYSLCLTLVPWNREVWEGSRKRLQGLGRRGKGAEWDYPVTSLRGGKQGGT